MTPESSLILSSHFFSSFLKLFQEIIFCHFLSKITSSLFSLLINNILYKFSVVTLFSKTSKLYLYSISLIKNHISKKLGIFKHLLSNKKFEKYEYSK
jgi:hypothetical protein